MDTSVRGVVDAYYSQFFLRVGEDGRAYIPWGSPLGLVSGIEPGYVRLTAARHFGGVSAEAQIFSSPPALHPAWGDVVEFSITAGASVSIDPWDPGATGFSVPLTPGVTYRVRFTIVDGEIGSQQFLREPEAQPSELYLLQFWPEPFSEAAVLRNESPWAQYWVFGALAETIIPTLSAVPAPERAMALVDLAFQAHPDVAKRVRNGEERYQNGIIAYLQALQTATYHDPDFAYLRDDPQVHKLLIERYIASKCAGDAAARAAGQLEEKESG
ncbi:hypothetical protein [Mycetocola zhadangensis]|uniref:Uncharacterized protein n=1 Tax=Mycetocola zhadangensis TaxID=1164595 RepID=A0A3L7J1N4_9MICO|nr:hypothetical protein [Mycetocola zhadangensis]RLQ84364.1 hypothetical protein D9V28_09205 [Mycetocola zhadangensis]GGE93572.1 hypothetical protein GCM10011313_15820 [Mycetocola zhadangensis]